MDELVREIQELSKAQFESLIGWMVSVERDRRRELEAQSAALTKLMADGVVPGPARITREQYEAGKVAPAWVDPAGNQMMMYPAGSVVGHADKVFESRVDELNRWEPGVSDAWEEVVVETDGGGDVVDGGAEVAEVAEGHGAEVDSEADEVA
ncbi:hypothetical protein [Corynebacterium sp. MC3]|uniref:hypothetical protein n=1 Tax=Corynebacterium sp. MC3 TaxID=1720193 RepID=UPI0008DA9B5C|nr:hypothetical protein [Corynebacterium sp. MC3]